jgi:hypothetical protein
LVADLPTNANSSNFSTSSGRRSLFFGHIFVFSLLVLSLERGALLVLPIALVGAVGLAFLVHSLAFFLFGHAMEHGGGMPHRPVYAMAVVGLLGVLYRLFWL